jgi:hypothetical protein
VLNRVLGSSWDALTRDAILHKVRHERVDRIIEATLVGSNLRGVRLQVLPESLANSTPRLLVANRERLGIRQVSLGGRVKNLALLNLAKGLDLVQALLLATDTLLRPLVEAAVGLVRLATLGQAKTSTSDGRLFLVGRLGSGRCRGSGGSRRSRR